MNMQPIADLLGESSAIVALRSQVQRLAERAQPGGRLPPLLILGETGTGKGLLAHALHQASSRHQGPFLDINCAAIPDTLVEAELFGFERGAFTDARQAKPGLFQAAHGGVLFLDEVGSLPPNAQAKLLTALEQRQVRRLGSTRNEPVDAWILSATNEDLAAAVARGQFRADLYHRLSTLTFQLPPLRERGPDIVRLAEHFLARACADHGLPPKRLAPETHQALLAYAWPGNVRELANVMERVALLTDGPDIAAELLGLAANSVGPGRRREPAAGSDGDSPEAERDRLRAALEATQWNLSRAAAQLGIPRTTLRYRIEKLDLRPANRGPIASPGPVAPAAHPPGAAATATPPSLRWERRWVTALRTVLRPPASTPVFQLAPLLEDLVDKLRAFDAHLDELHPAGLVALFGLDPVEDAPALAVRAARAVHKAVERTQATVGVSSAIHVAECLISRGGVVAVAGMDPLDKRRLTEPLEALLANAAPQDLRVSPDAGRFLERRFELSPIGSSPEVPATSYHVVGRGRSGFEVGGQTRSPFVGRDRELAALDDLLVQAEQGRGQVVGIVGEPGVGKSRLLYEFCQGLGGGRTTRLGGRCLPYGLTIPYLPILDVVQQNFALEDLDSPEIASAKVHQGLRALGLDAASLAPYLLHLLGFKEGTEPALAVLGPEAIKARTIDALRQLALGGSQLRPLIVSIEDVHWIDPTSDETLTVLVESLAACRVLLLTTYRPGYRPPWLGKSYASQLVLPPLSRVDSCTLVHALRPEPLSAELVGTIVAHADGVPFFLEELTRAIADHADLRSAVTIPDTVQGVLIARLHRLRPEEQQLLQAAAVLGKDVALPLLRAIVDIPDDEFRRDLGRLQAAEFLLETRVAPTPLYTFKHALTQEAAYRSLDEHRRRALHMAAAQAIERHSPETVERTPEVLARHYTEASLATQALTYGHRAGLLAQALAHWQAAAVRAIGRSAYVEAIHSTEQALAQLTQLPPDEARDRRELELLVMTLGPLIAVKGYASPEVDAASGRALALCRTLGDHETLFPTLYARWAAQYVLGHQGEAYALSREYLDQARAVGDDAGIVVGNRIHAVALLMRGDVEGAEGLAREALSLYVPERHQPLIARFGQDLKVQSLSYLAVSVALAGRLDEAWKLGEESLAHARSLNHINTLAYALWHIGVWLAAVLRRTDTVQRVGAELLDLSRTHRLGRWGAIVSPFLERGDAAERALTVYRRKFNSELTVPQLLCHFGEDYLESGRTADARRVLTEAGDLMEQHGELYWEPELFRLRGRLAAAEGRGAPEAPTGFERALALARQRGAHLLELRAATDLARWRAAQGQRAAARQMLAPVYAAFTEGFHAKDLQEAKAVLDELETSG